MEIITSLRVAIVTIFVCVIGYTGITLGLAQVLNPWEANGSIVYDQAGQAIGSKLVAQKFYSEAYFWPRPSAVDYNAAGAGGSNLSPLNPEITERARNIINSLKVDQMIPADLVTASGSGLDPHISTRAAMVQVPRIAAARNISETEIERLVDSVADSLAFIGPDRAIVNVLELNLALDKISGSQRH